MEGVWADAVLACDTCAGQTNTQDGSKATCVDVDDITVTEACSSVVTSTVDAYILDYAESITPCNRAGSGYSCDALYVTDYVTESSEVAHATFDHSVYVSPTAFHPLPAGMRAASSALMRTLLGDKGSISVTSHPLPDPVWSIEEDEDVDNSMIVSIFIVIGVSVLSASFCVFLVWEKSNNAKHLQMVSGVNKFMFWATAYLCDMLIYLFVLIAIMIIFAAADLKAFKDDNLVACGVLFFFFGLSCIPLTYTLHFSFVSEMNALAFLMGSFFFFGLGTLLCNIILEAINNSSTKPVYEITEYTFRLLPHYCVSKGVYDIMQNHLRDSDKEKDVWDMHVTGAHILFMAIEAVVYFAITVLIEYNENSIFAVVARFMTPQRAEFAVTDDTPDDEDVAAETARVKEGVKDTDSVVLNGLCKTYPTGKVAVQPMNVAMPKGECFGLLGINGAGKTTTFKMLTGEFGPTAGDAFVRGRATDGSPAPMLSIISDLNQARQVLGYCPQFDGIQPNMTAREHLWFYATIRGVEASRINDMCEELIAKMNLSQYADKMAGTYSGGNKRKLSVAIALVGNPPIVLLDEPSTGMDPEARRFMWDVISASMKGRAMVLTSHSMEECEALCHRVGIMVSGKFQCLGSVQHLKNRFSEGYMLDMRAKPEDISKVIEGVQHQIGKDGGVEVAEQHETHVKFRITAQMRLSQIFGEIEKLRQEANVVDYSLSQTTLEQVFVRFASAQTEETALAPGLTDKGSKAVELTEITPSQGVVESHCVNIPNSVETP
ncbi:hypothetical protein CYMTET_29347 [Cymbomonas tetramitiformis]|uniref:ABC transporter domain-containing protein n=1 Tax=Cymbomonas tetramitiformis TaxID=36881 RepID=A0AAE0FL60_9CHLO|nr:hypothetical protein CYMTET_29347 [Cymbomonas tetramitiformis]